MQKNLVFKYLHVTGAGQRIIGLDPAARFANGLYHALARHPAAARIVLCDDLAHDARPAEHARRHSTLKKRPRRVSLIAGNHQRRVTLVERLAGRCSDPVPRDGAHHA